MGELPILFSTPMVQAILDGRKTVTRRICKDANDYCEPLNAFIDNEKRTYAVQNYGDLAHTNYVSLCEVKMPICVGDRLWVRETWQCVKYDSMDGDLSYGVEFKDGARKYFEFDDNERYHQFGKFAFKEGWQPSIYLPKEAARIWLEVTNVSVERLREITYDDCLREGMWNYGTDVDTLAAFQELWQKLNAKRGYGWDTNPWAWVVEFKVVEK